MRVCVSFFSSFDCAIFGHLPTYGKSNYKNRIFCFKILNKRKQTHNTMPCQWREIRRESTEWQRPTNHDTSATFAWIGCAFARASRNTIHIILGLSTFFCVGLWKKFLHRIQRAPVYLILPLCRGECVRLCPTNASGVLIFHAFSQFDRCNSTSGELNSLSPPPSPPFIYFIS